MIEGRRILSQNVIGGDFFKKGTSRVLINGGRDESPQRTKESERLLKQVLLSTFKKYINIKKFALCGKHFPG